MELDDLQHSWRSQDDRIDEILRIGRRLQLNTELRGPRAALKRFKAAALLEIVLGIVCVMWSGSFIHAHAGEPRLAASAASLYLWLIGAAALALIRYLRAGAIEYGAPVIQIQQQVERLRVFTLRSLRVLFIGGVPVWTLAFPIMLIRSGLGVDLAAALPGPVLGGMFAFGAACAFFIIKLGDLLAAQFGLPAWLAAFARALSARELVRAQDQLARLAAFESAE